MEPLGGKSNGELFNKTRSTGCDKIHQDRITASGKRPKCLNFADFSSKSGNLRETPQNNGGKGGKESVRLINNLLVVKPGIYDANEVLQASHI